MLRESVWQSIARVVSVVALLAACDLSLTLDEELLVHVHIVCSGGAYSVQWCCMMTDQYIYV